MSWEASYITNLPTSTLLRTYLVCMSNQVQRGSCTEHINHDLHSAKNSFQIDVHRNHQKGLTLGEYLNTDIW